MTDGQKEKEDKELNHLIDKLLSTFEAVVKNEKELSNILLKGHLFIETLLEELIATLDGNKNKSIHRLSFSEKLRTVKEVDHKQLPYLKSMIDGLLPSIYALNEVRNNMAHNYNFALSENDINKIGVNLGSQYILHKYQAGHTDLKANLLFCLDKISSDIARFMYHKMRSLRKSESKK